MICIKCSKKSEGNKPVNLPEMLNHLAKYTVCNKCDNTGRYEKEYYNKHKENYRELHKKYKA